MDWIELIAAVTLFMLSHRIPAWIGVKEGLIARLGRAGYTMAFSAISLLLLWWLIVAAGRAPFVPLWDQAIWHRWAVNLLMPAAIALAVFGIGAPNPFAFEGRAQGYDPSRPGIVGVTRQPLLWALALWSGAHLLANGDLAHVILFTPFLLLALIGTRMVETRRQRMMGDDAWTRLTAGTSTLPLWALIRGSWQPKSPPDPVRLVLVFGTWAALWQAHAPVIGVWPGP